MSSTNCAGALGYTGMAVMLVLLDDASVRLPLLTDAAVEAQRHADIASADALYVSRGGGR